MRFRNSRYRRIPTRRNMGAARRRSMPSPKAERTSSTARLTISCATVRWMPKIISTTSTAFRARPSRRSSAISSARAAGGKINRDKLFFFGSLRRIAGPDQRRSIGHGTAAPASRTAISQVTAFPSTCRTSRTRMARRSFARATRFPPAVTTRIPHTDVPWPNMMIPQQCWNPCHGQVSAVAVRPCAEPAGLAQQLRRRGRQSHRLGSGRRPHRLHPDSQHESLGPLFVGPGGRRSSNGVAAGDRSYTSR